MINTFNDLLRILMIQWCIFRNFNNLFLLLLLIRFILLRNLFLRDDIRFYNLFLSFDCKFSLTDSIMIFDRLNLYANSSLISYISNWFLSFFRFDYDLSWNNFNCLRLFNLLFFYWLLNSLIDYRIFDFIYFDILLNLVCWYL